MIDDGARVQAFGFDGYFCDVGTPERLLEANRDVLAGRLTRGPSFSDVHATASVSDTVQLTHSSVGANAVVGAGAQLHNVCVQSNARVEAGAQLENEIVFPGGTIDVPEGF